MKIRCENCYKVLGLQEEYCTYCGTHSDKIEYCMKTGNYEGGKGYRLKIGLILFGIIAFFGNGLMSTIFAVVKDDASRSLFNNSFALFSTSILLAILVIIIFFKDLKNFFWNGNSKQLLGGALLGTIYIVICILASKLTKATRIIPMYMTDYLFEGHAKLFDSGVCIATIVVSLLMVAFVEEVIFRRLLVDALDENTMLSDSMIIIIAGIIGMVLDFAWIMSPETLIMSLVSNCLLAGLYANTNRSLGLNLILRVILIISQVVLFYR